MRSLILFSGAALGLLACASEEPSTGPSGSPNLARATTGAYTAQRLGTLAGPGFDGWSSNAYAINPKGQVVGSSEPASGVGLHAFLWEKGVMSDLGTLGGGSSGPGVIIESIAYGINPAGQVVGWSNTAEGRSSHAFLWEKGVMTDLGTLGGNSSEARAINPSGQVVGFSQTVSDTGNHAFLWEKGVMTDLGTLGGCCSEAYDINPSGQVVGASYMAGNATYHAFLWEKGVMTDLGTLGGIWSYARGLNLSGQVVGASGTASGGYHAALWEKGVWTDLGGPDPPPYTGLYEVSFALAINPAGQIVGSSNFGDYGPSFPVIWENGVISEVLPSGDGCCAEAVDINPAGQVVGAFNVDFGLQVATLYTRK